MELKVRERFMLLNLLAPIESDITTLRIVRALQEHIGFTEEETAALAFKQPVAYVCMKCGRQYTEQEAGLGPCPDCKVALQARPTGKVVWRPEADVPTEIEISPAAKAIIVGQFERASAHKALSLQQLELYEQFVPEEDSS